MARYFQGAFDLLTLLLLTKFSQNPLYLFALVGLPFVVLGSAIGAYLLANHILNLVDPAMGFPLTTRPLLIVAVFLFLIGLLMFLIGLVAELVLRSATLGKGYWIREIVGSQARRSRPASVPPERAEASRSEPADAQSRSVERR